MVYDLYGCWVNKVVFVASLSREFVTSGLWVEYVERDRCGRDCASR
jgi:hypothetical protein